MTASDAPRTTHELWVVRHGETEWSKSGRHTGRTDLALSEHGREQAKDVGALLAQRRFARVFVSPLSRARETCTLAGYDDQAELDGDLREWDYGDYEGLTSAEIQTTVTDWTVWDRPCPQGESIEEVSTRADRVIHRAREASGDVMVFAHGHLLRVLIARWCQLDPTVGKRFALDTATVSVLGWEHNYPVIKRFNVRS